MLDQMRRGAGSWIAKIFLGVLVLSFAVWGVADVFTGYGQGAIATVGDAEITPQEFERSYRKELNQFEARLGQRLTPGQARAFGIQTQVLSRLMGSAAIDSHAGELGLSLSDAALAKSIRNYPAFRDADGNFSKSRFNDILRRIDMSEAGFIADQRKEQLRRQLSNALAADIAAPAPMIDAMHRHQNETRVIRFFTLDPKISGKVPPPDEQALRTHYDQNKAQFKTPSQRKVALLSITRKDAKKRIVISEAALRKAYEATRQDYDVAEQRRIQQISFKDKVEAQKAYARLSISKNFDATAKALGFKQSDYDLGLLTKSDMVDDMIADAAFKLAKGKVSEPVEGLFRTVLLRVSEIKPGKISSFKQVKGKVREKLADEQASQELQTILDLVDEERGGGKTLKEIGAKLKISYRDVAAIDRFGDGPGGKPALKRADADVIAKAISTGGIGVENDVIDLPGGGYAWFDILGETQARQKSFDEVKDDVRAVYLDLERRRAIGNAARETAKRILHGESIEAVAKAMKLKVATTKLVKRADAHKGLSTAAISRAFGMVKGGAASAPTQDGKSRSIFTVTKVVEPRPPTKVEAGALRKSLGQQMTGDVMAEYVTALMKRYGQSINRAAFRRLIGAETQ